MGEQTKESMGDIFRHHGKTYRSTHKLPLGHLKVMRAIERCRTSALGGHVEQCMDCGFKRVMYNSCRNRQLAALLRASFRQILTDLPLPFASS